MYVGRLGLRILKHGRTGDPQGTVFLRSCDFDLTRQSGNDSGGWCVGHGDQDFELAPLGHRSDMLDFAGQFAMGRSGRRKAGISPRLEITNIFLIDFSSQQQPAVTDDCQHNLVGRQGAPLEIDRRRWSGPLTIGKTATINHASGRRENRHLFQVLLQICQFLDAPFVVQLQFLQRQFG